MKEKIKVALEVLSLLSPLAMTILIVLIIYHIVS